MSNGGWCWTRNLNKRAMLQEWVNSKSSKFVEHCHYVSLKAASWLAGKHWKPTAGSHPSPEVHESHGWLKYLGIFQQHTAAGKNALCIALCREFRVSPSPYSPWCSHLCPRHRKVRQSYWRCCSREGLQNLRQQHQAIFLQVPEIAWHSPQARDIE